MAIDGFSVSSNIPHLSDQMRQYTQQLQNELDDLWRKLTPMRESWVGSGANAYDLCQANWNGILGTMASSFASAQKNMALAYDNYQVTDLQIKGKFGGA